MENHFRKFSWSDNIASLSTSFVTNSPQSVKSEKLQAIKERQQANYQLIIMTNRIAKLKKDKELAEKEIIEAKKKTKYAKKQIKNKNQKVNDMLTAFQEKQELEEEARKKFKREREERKKNIKDFEKRIINEKKKIVAMKNKHSKQWHDEIFFNKFSEIQEKREKCRKIGSSYADSLRARCLSQRSHRSKIENEYLQAIESEKKIQNTAISKIADLEKLEGKLIEDLSNTIELRNHLITNLYKIKSLL